MHHFTNGCVRVLVLVYFRIAYIKCAWRKIILRDRFKYSWRARNTSFFFFLVVSCQHLCILLLLCTSLCVSFSFVRCEGSEFVYLTMFFRFVILFAWAVIVDAVQFTYMYVYTYVYICSHTEKVIKYPVYCDDNAYRMPLSTIVETSEQTNTQTNKQKKTTSTKREKKSVHIFFY